MDNDTFGAAVPGTTPTPQPNPNPIAPAEPSPAAPTSPAAPVATPADPGVPTVPTAEPTPVMTEPETTTIPVAEPISVTTPTPATETTSIPVAEAPVEPTPATAETVADSTAAVQPMGQPTAEELASNPFERPGADPFTQPTTAFPAELADAEPETPETPDTSVAPKAADTITPADAEATPTPTATVSEASPTTEAVSTAAAPVATPADPNAPTVPTTVGDDHVPEKEHKKKQIILIAAVVGAIAVIALFIVLYIFVFSVKTLSCEKSLGGENMKVTVNFRNNEAQSAKVLYTYKSDSKISDLEYNTIKEMAESDKSVYENIKVEKTDDNTVTVEMDAQRKLFVEKGKTYDEVKQYYSDDLGLTCK